VVDTSSCQQADVYTGEVCRETFTSLQACYSGYSIPPPALNIPSAVNQIAGESDAVLLIEGLNFLTPSPECREAFTPFLCLSIFMLCDSNDRLHTILRDDCMMLRDDICATEWNRALAFLPPGVLPVCEDLSDIADECVGKCMHKQPHTG
jgi:hypothetical protein